MIAMPRVQGSIFLLYLWGFGFAGFFDVDAGGVLGVFVGGSWLRASSMFKSYVSLHLCTEAQALEP